MIADKISDHMLSYLKECFIDYSLCGDDYLKSLEFLRFFTVIYGRDLDCAAIGHGIMFALDDGVHHCEFELVHGNWEFFYRNRETDEMYDCDVADFDTLFSDVDKYIRRVS